MNSVKFAIITDTHLGYGENDMILQNDSFEAFDEALDIAQEENVDFILHAGDMYDTSTPSTSTIVKTNQVLLNHSYTTSCSFTDSNGEINIKFPIFVISGNHDQPSGVNLTSPCEILQSVNLIYYFEKFIDTPKFILKPVIIEKGDITIAIYGLTYINNVRFISLLENTIMTGEQIIMFENPPEEASKRFNILLVHQDRSSRNNKKPEALYFLSEICPWMDLIIWGHEHDNKAEIENDFGFKILQQGSTIITQIKKYDETRRGIGIIELFDKDNFKYNNIFLRKPRSLIINEFDLSKILTECDTPKKIENKLREKIKKLIDKNENTEKLPLVRINITSNSVDLFNNIPYKRICFEFSDEVANPNNIISVPKRKNKYLSANSTNSIDQNEGSNGPNFISSPSTIEESLSQTFLNSPLEVLPVDYLNKNLTAFINGDNKSFDKNIKNSLDKITNYLMDIIPPNSCFTHDDASKFIDSNKPYNHLLCISDHSSSPKIKCNIDAEVKNDDNLDEATSSRTTTKTRGRGRGGNRTRGGRKSKNVAEFQSNFDENSNRDETPLPPKKKKKPRVKNQMTLDSFIEKNKK